MTTALQHRGPDGDGFWFSPAQSVGLGHRRLSIIDLAGGAQPMHDDRNQLHIVFNGEIYNYLQLKQTLQSLGHRFLTNSDTEVILYAYKQWGKSCVNYLRGMFALAIADDLKSELFLARDHFGIKPLYYFQDATYFAFGSEIQAIKTIPGINLQVDWSAIDRYLWLQYIPHPQTGFLGMKKLPPAHTLSVSYSGEVGQPEPYWQFDFVPEQQKSEEDWLAELDQVLRESVQAHLVSDVPLGAFLSGGIDSTLVVGYMAQMMSSSVKTFSIGFPEEKYNELNYAQAVAQKWETDHHVEIVQPQGLDILPDLVKHYGEPFADSSAIPTWYVSKLARSQVTIALTGDGGDEFFAGYSRYLNFARQLQLFPLNAKKLKSFLYPLAHAVDPFKYPNNIRFWEGASSHNLMENIRLIPYGVRKQLWKSDYADFLTKTSPAFELVFPRGKGLSSTNAFQLMDINTYLPLDILTKVDVASMMHSLEVRPPLIDTQVAQLAARIPTHFNLTKVNGQFQGKALFKKLLKRHFDDSFVYREKKGFAVPLEFWFGQKGGHNHYLQEKLLGRDSKLRDIFQPQAIQRLIQQKHFSPAIWSLLFLEEWLSQNT